MSNLTHIQTSRQVRDRMQACREELAALKRLLRATEAAEAAEAARCKRRSLEQSVPVRKEGRRHA